ncbi:MAG: DUF3810 domain-containing protein [Oscillospiraceae bacterium]|nr:DUF3810 domain-containing protein [Oscillospiraceae bacterium]
MTAVKEARPSLLRKKRFWLCALIPISWGLNLFCRYHPGFTERYISGGVYRALSQTIALLTGWLPYSLAEWSIVLGVPLIFLYIIRTVYIICRFPAKRRGVWSSFAANFCCAAGIFSALYVVLCGSQYYRCSFAELAGLTVRASSPQELGDFCEELTALTVSLREQVPEDGEGVSCGDASFYETARKTRLAMDLLAEDYPELAGHYPAPKPVFFSRALSASNLEGIFCPFTMEANVNRDSTAFSRASTLCHEQVHLRGFIREDEANYIAYLACLRSDDPMIRYSGAMLATIHSMNQLYEVDRERFVQIHSSYSAGMLRDLSAHSAYWKQFEGKISDFGNRVNDVYLKANHQQDGVQSYGRMVDLLLAEYRQRHGLE